MDGEIIANPARINQLAAIDFYTNEITVSIRY
jgi:hypothetical protein